MNTKLFLFIILILPLNVKSQNKNEIRLIVTNNNLTKDKLFLVSDSANYLIQPEVIEKSTSYAYSIYYIRKFNHLNVYLKGGIQKTDINFSRVGSSTNSYFEQKDKSLEKSFEIALGSIKEFIIPNSPLTVNLGIGINVKRTYEKKIYNTLSNFDINHELLNEEFLEIKFTSNSKLGLNFEYGIMYNFFKKYRLGIIHNSWFYWERENGINLFNRSYFDEDKILLSEDSSKQLSIKNRFRKSHFWSFIIAYQF